MKIDYKGIMENIVTFKESGTVNKGDFVKISDNDTVSKCAGGDSFDGIAVNVSNGIVAVKLSGFEKVDVASQPSFGRCSFCVNSDGKLESASTGGTSCLVVNYDAGSSQAVVYFG